ncbi:MAG: hypothetical protein IT569_10215 [Leptospiraceae bacterium]|nr:hypothetical protein [Leptospiraceae bacterium]
MLDLNLPEYDIIQVRNEIDRFGFSYRLAEICGKLIPPKSHANWQHGWIWWNPGTLEEFAYEKHHSDIPTVLSTNKLRDILKQFGFINVAAGGLPFAYIPPTNLIKRKDTLLAFLPHSLHYIKENFEDMQFLDYLADIKKDFESVVCSIYYDDWVNGGLVQKCKRRGLDVISGARSDDKNSLLRIRTLLDQFEYVSSNTMGSHILYAALSGCKIQIAKPMYSFEHYSKIFKQDYLFQKFPHLLDAYSNAYDEENLKKWFPFFFVEHPKKATLNIEWAGEEIGIDNLLQKNEIEKLLGWTFTTKSKAILRAVKRRVNLFTEKV